MPMQHRMSRPRTILLVSGYSQSGKNTFGDCLEGAYGFRQYAFADALKRHVATEYGFPFVWTQTQEGKQQNVPGTDMSVRDLLIKEGQEIRKRANNPGFFADLVMNQIETESAQNCVITDWRLPEELATIEARLKQHPMTSLKKIRIIRQGQTESPVQHWTETSLSDVSMDGTLVNPGTTLTGFFGAIDVFCAQQGIRKYFTS